MKTALEFLEYLQDRDVKLSLEGTELRCNAPRNVLTPELIAKIKEHKEELTALLKVPTGSDIEVNITKSLIQDDKIPLSSGQQRLWSLNELQPDTCIYNVPTVYRLTGELDVPALEHSFGHIQERHEILRTTFLTENNQHYQTVNPDLPFKLPVSDITSLSPVQQEKEVIKRQQAEMQLPFNLNTGPVWRCELLKLVDNQHIILITMHHIVFDRYSKAVFLQELQALYSSMITGTPINLPALSIQYRDFVYWQQDRLKGKLAESQLSYWRRQLENTDSELQLPTDHTRPLVAAFKGKSQPIKFDPALSVQLDSLCRTEKASMYMLLLAGFSALLYRHTSQKDMVICSPIACRSSTSLEALIGYINNVVPMRLDLSENPTFSELIQRVRRTSMGANINQDVSFQKITSLTRIPLTRGMFNYRSTDSGALNLPGITATPVENRRHQADFDLALYLGREDDSLTGVLDYNADVFKDVTITQLIRDYHDLLKSIATNPDQKLNQLPRLHISYSKITTILEKHPKVDEAIVDNRMDKTGALCLVAYLVLNEDDVPSLPELREFLTNMLPDYLIPVSFIPIDLLPRTSDGRIDYNNLPAPTPARSSSNASYVAPRTPLETELAEIWQRILWQDQPVGIQDNFFDLGGHSLLSVQLIIEMEQHLRLKLPQVAISQLSTIAELVECLDQDTEPDTPHTSLLQPELYYGLRNYTAAWQGVRADPESLIVGLNTNGSKQSLFWCLQRYYELSQLAKYLGNEQPVYGMRSGHNVMEKTQTNTNALGAYYVNEIIKVQPMGPYLIGGNCQAADIALQVAKQLMNRGYKITLLCLQEKFVPLDYSGRIAFFFGKNSNRNPYYYFRQPERGWKKFYTGEFEVNIVSGAHGQFHNEPNIQDLTKKLQSAIERAQAIRETKAPRRNQEKMQRLSDNSYKANITFLKMRHNDTDKEAVIAVEVENSSQETWLSSESSGIFLGAYWSKPPFSREQPAPFLAALPADLNAGDSIQLDITVEIPDDQRTLVLTLDMVDEGVSWFVDRGSRPCQISIQRNSSAQT